MEDFEDRPLIRSSFAIRIGVTFLGLALLPLVPSPEMPAASAAIGVAFVVWGILSHDKRFSN
jgi:hypothetical protein